MKKFLISIFLFTLFLGPLKTVSSIGTKTVIGGTAVVGIASGVASYFVMKELEKAYPELNSEKKKYIKMIAILLAVGGGGGLAYWLLSKHTPDGRLRRATELLEKVKRNPLLKDNLSDDDVNRTYLSLHLAWPLVYAAKDLELSKEELQKVSELVEKVSEEVGSERADLQQRLQQVDLEHGKLNDLSRQALEFVYSTRSDGYQEQLQAYQAEKRRVAEQRDRARYHRTIEAIEVQKLREKRRENDLRRSRLNRQ